jgi:hypothetical protein
VPDCGATSGSWQHDYSTKARQVGHASGQSIYFLMFMILPHKVCLSFVFSTWEFLTAEKLILYFKRKYI